MTALIDRPAASVVPDPPPEQSGSAWLAWLGWRGARWVEPTILSGLVLVVLVVHAVNIVNYPTANDDEGTYLAQAYAVRHGWGLAHYTYWYDHPPFAWMQLAGLSWVPELLLPHAMTVGAGRLAMLPVTAVSLVLVHLLTRRLGFPRWAGWLAVAFYGLSPLSVTLMRQIYLDGFAVMWILAAFVLARSPRRLLWHYLAAGAATAAAVLSKETFLVVVPALLFTLWQGSHRSVRMFAVAGFVSSLLLVCSFYPLYALLKGELLPGDGHVSLVSALQWQLGARAGTGGLMTAGTAAHDLVGSWLRTDPVMVVAGVVATLFGLAVRRLRGPALASATLIVVALRPGGYLPAMYVVGLLPFFALLFAGSTAVVVRLATRPGATLVALMKRAVIIPGMTLRPPRPARPAQPVRVAAVGVMAGLALALVTPGWVSANTYALTAANHNSYISAADWVLSTVESPEARARTRVVVDDTLWLDLVRNGFAREHVIWFYKLDVDPDVSATLPQGWRDVDLVLATPVMRGDRDARPTLDALFAHSTVVASFGEGDGRIDIRRVDKETP
jgi:hypothetical protein